MSFSNKSLFLLSISLFISFCQNQNKTQETQEANINSTNTTSSSASGSDKFEFNMTVDEMDTIIICAAIVHETLPKKEKDIDEAAKILGYNNSNALYEKVGTEIFEKCVYNISINTVNKFMKNLTYFNNFQWEKSFDEYTNINLTKYTRMRDLRLSLGQKILMYKYAEVNELYKKKIENEYVKIDKDKNKNETKETQTEKKTQEQTKMKKDTESVKDVDPMGTNLKIFLAGLIILFGVIFFLMKKMGKKQESDDKTVKEKIKEKVKGKEKKKKVE